MNTQEGNKHRGGMINKSTKTSPFLVLPVGDAGNEANLRIPDPLGPVLKRYAKNQQKNTGTGR